MVHVTGSVLGKIDNSGDCATSCGALNGGAATADKYQGNAYEAKVAFFDIGLPNARFLNVPNNMFTMTEPAYRVGARIHTNSWGSSSNSYTTARTTSICTVSRTKISGDDCSGTMAQHLLRSTVRVVFSP